MRLGLLDEVLLDVCLRDALRVHHAEHLPPVEQQQGGNSTTLRRDRVNECVHVWVSLSLLCYVCYVIDLVC